MGRNRFISIVIEIKVTAFLKAKICTLVYFWTIPGPAQPTLRYKVHCWTRMGRTSWTKKILLLLLTGNFDLKNGCYNMSLCRSSAGLQIICCVTCPDMGWPFSRERFRSNPTCTVGNSAITLAQHLSVTGAGPVKTYNYIVQTCSQVS